MKTTLLILALLIVATPVSAYSLSNVRIIPDGDLVSGTPVKISFTVNFESAGNYTFNPAHELQLATTLESPEWTRVTGLDGEASKPIIIPGNIVTFYGYDLAYPIGTYEWLNITLEGHAPQFNTTSRTPLLKIGELNGNTLITNSVIEYQRTIIHPDDLKEGIYLAGQDLKTFLQHIEEKKSLGLDVSAAQAQYADAQQSIEFVKTLSAQDYLPALARLNTARNTIIAGEDLLNQEGMQTEIERAIVPLAQTDKIIGWFVGNKSTQNYPGLSDLKIQRQAAANLIDNASLAMNAKAYAIARADAESGFKAANSTYYAALGLQQRAEDPLTPVRENLIWIGLAIAVIVGWLLFRKKKPKRKEKEGGNENVKK
jgi:hypothetical protein